MEFTTSEAKHEMSALYEERIAQMGNAGRAGGQYYTPRPLIKTIVKIVKPQIGEKVYDGAVGSAGFLVEAFEYMKAGKQLTPQENDILQNETFFGKELKTLAYSIGIMNMILHSIEAPNIIHTNTLTEDVLGMEEKDRVDVILANPPFGASGIGVELQENFPIKSGASELLFMQHFMAKLKAGGRAGVVIKNTFLSNTDNATIAVRQKLLEKFNLEMILDLPSGVFQGAGVKTVVLFFKKGESTKNI
jgi:type I restriction enzyme M protein